MRHERQVLAALKRLRDEGPMEPDVGICGNIWGLFPIPDRLDCDEVFNAYREHVYATWPHYSGDVVYPVTSTGHLPPEAAYNRACREGCMWEGTYGDLRRDLLRHLIEYYEELVK